MGFGLLPKSHVFKGTKEIKKDQILEQMGFLTGKTKPTTGVITGARDGVSAESIGRYLLPASECEFMLNSVKNSPFIKRRHGKFVQELGQNFRSLVHRNTIIF